MLSILTNGIEKGGKWLAFAGYSASWSLLFVVAALFGAAFQHIAKPSLMLAFVLSVFLVFRAYKECETATYMQINFLMICVVGMHLSGLTLVSVLNSAALTADVLMVSGVMGGALILPIIFSTQKRILVISSPLYLGIYIAFGIAINGLLIGVCQ